MKNTKETREFMKDGVHHRVLSASNAIFSAAKWIKELLDGHGSYEIRFTAAPFKKPGPKAIRKDSISIDLVPVGGAYYDEDTLRVIRETLGAKTVVANHLGNLTVSWWTDIEKCLHLADSDDSDDGMEGPCDKCGRYYVDE